MRGVPIHRLTTVRCACVLAGAAIGSPVVAQEAEPPRDDSRFVDAAGVRLHYLDFGGEGVPLVLVHSEAWDAHTYADFAPRFTGRNRVLAVTRPGYGESEPHPDGFGVPTQVRSLIDFLDALGIERAVFAGNASATAELTYLGEHHADRVAGLIYFTGLAVPWVDVHKADPTRAFEMFGRADPGAMAGGERVRARQRYRPELMSAERPTTRVPALAFVARSGTMGQERGIPALALVGSPLIADVRAQLPPSPVKDHLERLADDEEFRSQQLNGIRDPEARDYFLRLAADPALQAEVQRYHEARVLPAVVEGQERFRRAFGGGLQLVRLDVPQVVGYEYRDDPDLLEPHITRFLAGLAPPLVIRDVSVVDVREGTLLPQRTVVIRGDRITAVGPAGDVAVPADARVVDGTGRFLIPGLWDMHAHTGSDRETREVVYPLFVAHGVTGIRNMGADCFDCPDSIERVHARRRDVAAGKLIGPRVVASSDYIGSHEEGPASDAAASSPQDPRTESDARALVGVVKDRGVDFIKIYDMLPRDAYFALAEEAKRIGLPFAGHVPVEVRASEASDAGHASIEHPAIFGILSECSAREEELRGWLITELHEAGMGSRYDSEGSTLLRPRLAMVDTYDPEKCAALAERFVRNRTWVVPTLMVSRLPDELGTGWREDPYARFLTPQERRYFEWEEEVYARDLGDANENAPVSRWVREVTRAMHRAGVPMLAGSDAGTSGVFWGISLHQELELLVSAGFSEAEALRAATLGPAEFLEMADSLGAVEAGKRADLVLLDANPLEDITNTQRIAGVVVRGRFLDRDALDELLTDVEGFVRSLDDRE